MNKLAAIAASKLQGELAKDGRESSGASQGLSEKSLSNKAASATRSSGKTRGMRKHPLFAFFLLVFVL